MLTHFVPGSGATIAMLLGCFALVLMFEATNGFHDTSNAVATVIYTNALKSGPAVVWSGVMNFVGVLVGGIAVAYALVEILPPDVLTPPDGSPAVPMLVSLFISALVWNILTWSFGIPNSSSHCIIGALIGVAIADALLQARSVTHGVDWHEIWTVLEALAISPVLGLVLAGGLYGLLRVTIHRGHLFEPPKPGETPTWWLRGLLILTCTTVSFSHGTNDGQKSIGLIMLTIVGLLPASFAINPATPADMATLARDAGAAMPLIRKYGDAFAQPALQAAMQLQAASSQNVSHDITPTTTKSQLRGDVYFLIKELRHVPEVVGARPEDKARAAALRAQIAPTVQFAPIWVRMLSALCLGVGTMVGYKRVVHTLGERLGKSHMTPGQGASAELVGSVLIGTAGLTGLPVSTTHIITSGIAGTMLAGGQGLHGNMLARIIMAWAFTLPATMLISGALFYVLNDPGYADPLQSWGLGGSHPG